MNGREIPAGWFLERFDKILEENAPFDVLAVMLGTNDILNSFQPDAAEAGRNMEAFLLHALNHPQIIMWERQDFLVQFRQRGDSFSGLMAGIDIF